MKFIIDFYQSLDALNIIIFWGIIIVILLLIVFIILMIGKKKKNKPQNISKNYKDELYSNEIALPSNSRDTLIMKADNLLIQEEKQSNFEPFVIPKEQTIINEKVEVEKNFHAEEHVMEYDNEKFKLSHVKKNNELPLEETQNENKTEKQPFQIPTKPYERNVLREMSLGQTSPIGIVRNDQSYNKPIMKPQEQIEQQKNTRKYNIEQEEKGSANSNHIIEEKTTAKPVIEKNTTVVKEETIISKKEPIIPSASNYSNNHYKEPQEKNIFSSLNKVKVEEIESIQTIKNNESLTEVSPIKNNDKFNFEQQKVISSNNATFLEEVSKKLAEADVQEEIDRTDYELQQEEDAIISYKELMAKKDTIKTIDEEDAVISIQELTSRKNKQEKLYNLTEEEENDDFLDELKKFRNDLN